MAGKPKNFQVISNVLPTYNFVDIISGTGYINFYGGRSVSTYALSNFTFYSEPYSSSGAINFLADTTVADLDFDVTINRPLTLQGTAIINVPMRLTNEGNEDSRGYIKAYVRKYDGAESDLVSGSSSTMENNTDTNTTFYMTSISLAVPKTNFKIGDKLRLTIELHGYVTADTGHATSAAVSYDPNNRSAIWDTTGAVPSRLSFQCPVRLNL